MYTFSNINYDINTRKIKINKINHSSYLGGAIAILGVATAPPCPSLAPPMSFSHLALQLQYAVLFWQG